MIKTSAGHVYITCITLKNMDRNKELKLKKLLQYHLSRKIITKKEYKKEIDFINKLKENKKK
jgi:hypothetical protein